MFTPDLLTIGGLQMDEKVISEKRVALLAEDDAIFRRLLAKKLTAAGFEVREAVNGLMAKTIFDLSPSTFSLVITDVRMPELDGVQLLAHIRKTSKVPVVVMTGFSEILESKAALDLGANGFLPKPFKADTLLGVIEDAINPQAKSDKKDSPNTIKFCQVHISEFISSTHLVSDLYVRIAETKYVKVAHRGDAIPVERLKVYQERKVDFLYVALEDFSRYVDFNIRVSQSAVNSPMVNKQMKLKLLQNTSEAIAERCFLGEIDPETLGPAQQMLESTLQLASEDQDILQLVTGFQGHCNKLYAHSVAVSFFSCMIARQHGWTSTNTLFKVSISGLLHEIGKKELPSELLAKSRLQLTASEIKHIETHPLRGRDIINKIPSLPEDIGMIVAQHHENIFGSGYPLRIKGEAVHPIARIIAVADRFCSLIIPVDPGVVKISPKEAAIKLRNVYADELDQKFVTALLRVLKVDERAPGRSIGAAKAS